ncbi:hypothetical protein CHF27_009695 [Romboutsia maritimum]|uniref:L-2-amino-thiazoline-4-carboxylic acid hydrolase n=1 Tax=Romboutsia maritimum TaxID=2020948 RepID=A0A371IRJ8_9FIRM|nr:L-2-amino-thiazoline-4-carboxylic acid hydrolase [Romboutsia maritimum]RDY23108.1 hypothetical protein CHF27_009695 [Romboutsia maritimum]
MKYDIHARIVWSFLKKDFKNELEVYYNNKTTKDILKKAKKNYKKIILRSPYIGGIKNPFTTNILTGAMVVSIYKAGDGMIKSQDVGNMLTNIFEKSSKIKIYIKIKSKNYFTHEWQIKRNQLSKKSRIRKYKSNFVSEFIYGPSVNEYGVNFYECGICKLFSQEKVTELIPYMCKLDFIISNYMGAYLQRTKTLANGDGVCNFWYLKK